MKTKLIILVSLFAVCACHDGSKANLEPFRLDQVKLLEGPFLKAQQTDIKYILEMDVDRLLAPYLIEAGLTPKAPKYPNWEGDGLSGHIGGHYLSALAMMYAASGDTQIKERLDYMIGWLKKCQDANGNGYIGGIPDGKRIWDEIAKGEIRADYFSLNERWVPLYNIHKIFAGLRDAYLFTDSKLALEIWIALSDWWLKTTVVLSDDQIQQMLKSEHGGLNEVFADLYEVTQDTTYLSMAKKLSHRVLLDPLLLSQDHLTGKHANTQIPKVIGYERIAQVSSNDAWQDASAFFWETVVQNRSVAFGGNSVREHFHSSDDFKPMLTSEQGPETCNTYNMMRLSKMLFESSGDTRYLDFYERAQFNHILSSQHPEGGFVYFTPARPRHYRVYSQPNQGMWCCVGSGLENHTKYGELIYAHRGEDLYVNLFIASSLNWSENGIELIQNTSFPEEEETTFKLKLVSPKSFKLNMRLPEWMKSSPELTVNGEPVSFNVIDGYAQVERHWVNGDQVAMKLPMTTRLELLPDSSAWAAYMHGPILMAAVTDSTDLDGLWADDSRMGHVAAGKFYPINEAPVLVGNAEFLTSMDRKGGMNYSLDGKYHSEIYSDLSLVPFYKIHEARYMMYWPVTDSSGLEQMIQETKKEEAERIALKELTVDVVKPGEQQPEADHFFKGERTYMGYSDENYWRSGDGWFEYTLRNPQEKARFFQFSFAADRPSSFVVSLNGQRIDLLSVVDKKSQKTYPMPDLEQDKSIIVRFEAINQSHLPRVLDVRLLSEGVIGTLENM